MVISREEDRQIEIESGDWFLPGLDDVYLEQFQHDGNAQAFAEAYTGFFKAAFEPYLFANLSDKRTPQSRQHVIDLFSQRLQAALAQDPKKYSCRWVLHLMLISKRQN